MKLDHNSDKPLHIQAEEILRRLIESEEYKKRGSYFPNEVELSEQLHISRNTFETSYQQARVLRDLYCARKATERR